TVLNNADISTLGDTAYGIYASSRGGNGGGGGWGVGLYGEGGDGGYGGKGGIVTVTNNGQISTLGDESHGLLAESVGGAGGNGGSGWGAFGNGGDGGGNADAASVTVTNTAFIETQGYRASSIYAWSVGGGENKGGGAGGIFSWGGDGATGGDGKAVTVNNTGSLVTRQSEASALYAESMGGTGGNGGDSGSVGPYLSVAIGGSGGPGGNGDTVSVTTSDSTITTGEDSGNPGEANPLVRFSHGIFATSKGGGGGQGGFAFSVAASDSFSASFAFGGSGGGGGDGSNVLVDNQSALFTYGDESHGVFAQSLGGGGGNGGFAFAGSLGSNGSLSVAFGGTGGLGGDGSTVDVLSQNSILTKGVGSYGIFAQSVGGGGGSGGDSISISGSGVASGALSMGGDGGGGGHGGLLNTTTNVREGVSVTSSSDITTLGDTSHGILAQSVGGGGGDGGMAISGSFASTGAVAVALGGGSGTGGDGGTVDVTSSGTIMTGGYKANGIYAQSTGKGGGTGGMSIAVTGTWNPKGSAGLGVSLGGSGGGGGKGDKVTVVNDGTIITTGDESSGIKAQSVGGGGGDGGFSLSGGISGPKSLNAQVAIGGSGGSGNTGGIIDVINNGEILTSGFMSHGIFAESAGGGGGTGGSSVTATLGLVDKTVGVGVSLGGGGGDGGFGQLVSVTNNDHIETKGNVAYGIFAQSVGGGGGTGGAAYSGSAALSHPDSKFNMNVNVAIGGGGGTGGHGGAVDLVNTGLIETWGINAHGIYGQSVGGGGGVGGNARTMSLTQCWWECSPKNVSLSLSMGGAGGAAGNGGSVTIDNYEDIITHSTDSHGIWAQSVGGGGGNGGDGAHGFWGVPTVGISKTPAYLDVSVAMGGSQGASGNGGDVTVTNNGSITTLDDGSFGVYAQSVGGGGGHGGHGAIGFTGKVGVGGTGGAAGDGGDVDVTITGDIDTSGGSAHGIFAQSVGGGGGVAGNIVRGLSDNLNFGIGVGITKNGGNGGDGGDVDIVSTGNIVTRGQASNGIFAQSVGGGGGLTGDNGTGIAFSGSAGGDGAGGTIDVNHTGNITTLGDNSHGIFAQSGGGEADNVAIVNAEGENIGYLTDKQDTGGDITITLDGDLSANGADANGIYLQSKGADGNGDISVSVTGMVQGGSGDSTGVRMLDGATNTLDINGGSVTTLNGIDGTAIYTTAGDDTINNTGTVTGSVELGLGNNGFNNGETALFNSGAVADLGGGTFANAGIFSPGGSERVFTTHLDGALSQTGSGNYELDYDIDAIEADRINVTGAADLSGDVTVSELNLGYAREETNELTIVSSSSLSQADMTLVTIPSIVLTYDLFTSDQTDLVLRSSVDFTPDPPPGKRLKKNQRAIGNHIADIQGAGGSALFAPVAEAIFHKPDFDSLTSAYDHMLPALYLNADIATFYSSMNFHNALFSCPQRTGAHRFISEGECNWLSVAYNELDYEDNDETGSFREKTLSVSAGVQRPLDEKWSGGFGFTMEQIDLDSDTNASSDGDRVQAGVALKRRSGANMVATAVSVGYGSYDSVRVVDLPEGGVSATSDQNIWFGAAQVRVSHDKEFGDWYLRPSLAAGVTYVDTGSFREEGAGGANLDVDSYEHTVFSVAPAIEVGGEINNEGTLLRPYAKAGVRFYSDTDTDLDATLEGAPAGVSSFTTSGRLDNSIADLSAGVNFLMQDGYSVRLSYTGRFSDRVTDHGGMIKFSLPF
ncbi:MAG: hypothetical protein PVH54_03960, partial [Gammaproteobacteria bacterium]